MRQRRAEPSHEELAAYVDGELDAAARARVHAWLIAHPQAAEEVEALRRLNRLLRTSAAPEPDEPSWNATFERIQRQAEQQRRDKAAAGLWLRVVGLAVPVAAAAAVLLAVLLSQLGRHEAPAPEAVVPFPVLAADDVEIISVDHGDRHALLVGMLPLVDPIVLVGPGDATEIHTEPDVDGMVAKVADSADGMGTTMIVVPVPSSAPGVDEKAP